MLPCRTLPPHVSIKTVPFSILSILDDLWKKPRRWLVVVGHGRGRLDSRGRMVALVTLRALLNGRPRWRRRCGPVDRMMNLRLGLRRRPREVGVKAVLIGLPARLGSRVILRRRVQHLLASAAQSRMNSAWLQLRGPTRNVACRFLRMRDSAIMPQAHLNVVLRPRKAARKVKGILGHLDSRQKIHGTVFWLRHLCMAPHHRHLQKLIDRRPMTRIHLQQDANDFGKVIAEVWWDPWILASQHLPVEALHVLCAEWRSQRHHLVQYAT